MNYWNQTNFEGLKAIGEHYAGRPGYEDFGRFCLLREQGLKKPAMAAVRAFVADVAGRPVAAQRDLAEELAALGFWHAEVHQLLPHPLRVWLQAVLSDWVSAVPDSASAHRWLAYIGGDGAHFETALSLDPDDEISRTRLIQRRLGTVDWQTHHLYESHFLGDPEVSEQALADADALIAGLTSERLIKAYRRERDELRHLLDSWYAYQAAGTDQPFPDWCETRGEDFAFTRAFYYQA